MKRFHPLTPFFTRTITERIAVANNCGIFHESIQQLEAGRKYPLIVKHVDPFGNAYYNFPAVPSRKIMKILEDNSITHFAKLKNCGVDIHTYVKGEPLDTKSQPKPDNTFDFQKSQFIEKRIHGMDHKAISNPRYFENQIYSQITAVSYREILRKFGIQISLNNIDLTAAQYQSIQRALKALGDSCDNLELHQIIWAENLHYFPNHYIPPLKVPQTFAINDLIPEAIF